jgi:hypothetical protein
MDGQRFDALARALSGGVSRRRVLHGAVATVTGLLALPFGKAQAQEVVVLGTPVACPPTTELCDGQCVDLMSDDNNCGSCFSTCQDDCYAGLACGEICINGNCQCGAGRDACGDEFPTCTDILSNPVHCGDCFNECAVGESCVQGICTTSGGVEETPTAGPAEPSSVAQPTATEETPTAGPAEPSSVAQPTATEEQGVSELPATGSGPDGRGVGDLRIPLIGAGAAFGTAAIARLRGRLSKEEDIEF